MNQQSLFQNSLRFSQPLLKPIKQKEKILLNSQDTEKIVHVWKERNFGDFNNWMQSAKAQAEYEFTEVINKNIREFLCVVKVTFQDPFMPKYESKGFGSNKKDSKKIAVENVVRNIIQDGYINQGFKEPEFLIKIQNQFMNLTKKYSGDLDGEEVPKEDEEYEENKRKVNRLCRRMQELLFNDNFMEACEVICQIINKKKPDWNEISHIWCYALLKKNIVFLKVIIDLIQEKSYIAKKTQLKPDTQKQYTELETMTKKELMKKYGNSRLESDNPYDIVDSFNVLVNIPELDDQVIEANQDDIEKELVKDPFNKNLDDLLKPAEYSEEEQQKIQEDYKSYQRKVRELGFKLTSDEESLENPRKMIKTENNSDQLMINAELHKEPQMSQRDAEQEKQAKITLDFQNKLQKQYNEILLGYKDIDTLTFQQLQMQYQMMWYQHYYNQYNSTGTMQMAQIDQVQFQYQFQQQAIQAVLQHQKLLQNQNKLPHQMQSSENNVQSSSIQYQQQIMLTNIQQNKEKQYMRSNLNQDILQKQVMQNLSGNGQQKAQLIAADSIPIIDQNTAREIKDPSVNYISYKLLDEMYDCLCYIGDLNFSLNVAELLYTKIKLNDAEFINSQACYYYGNKKNMLMVELLESIFQIFNKNISSPVDQLMNLDGNLTKIGNKNVQEVLIFTPSEKNISILDSKILKKGMLENRDNYHQIAEGEFVMLTTYTQNIQEKQQELIQNKLKNQPENQLFKYMNSIQTSENESILNIYNTITDDGKNVEFAMISLVREVQKDYNLKLFVLPTTEQQRILGEVGRVWKITKLVNRTTTEKTEEALQLFCTQINMSNLLLQILLTPPICNQNQIRQLSETQIVYMNSQFIGNNNLNPPQQKALKSSTTNVLTLIQGPPGTGKTTTAVEIVLEWTRQNPNSQILACADSNVAVDLLHCEFQKAGIRTLRIGPNSDIKNDLKNDQRYKSFQNLQYMGMHQNAANVKYSMMNKAIQEAQVICATNVGSMSEYIEKLVFTRVIIDEATQSTEMACLIPLIKNCQQLVLIGDHKQLPPTVLSVFAQSKGMTVSLFERLVKQGVQPQMLVLQYRMHPSIAVFPSHEFYNNLLENGVGDLQRPVVKGFNWPNPLVRVSILNTIGFEQIYSSSVQNNKEVEVVIEILMQLLKGDFIKISQIGIITPYDAQKRRIRNEINHQARKFPALFGLSDWQSQRINRNSIINDVDTVDGYQGMERDVIIISTVRSNTNGNLGFLKDPRRMNVALTRAKRGLIIVGNISTLSNDEHWRNMINWGKANKIIINYY